MNKIILFFFLFLFATEGFANSFVLNNQMANSSSNPFRIAIQWASSAKEIKEYNNKIKHGMKLNLNSLRAISRAGKISINIPENMEYFRILVWSRSAGKQPELLTNWVDIIPHKTYSLNQDQLSPLALISGMGC